MICTQRRTTLTALALACMVSGCATHVSREDSAPPQAGSPVIYQAQVAIGSCMFRPRTRPQTVEAIAGALVSSAISQGINHLGRAIDEAGKGSDDRVTASRNIEVSATTLGPCVQVVRGWFHRGFDDRPAREQALNLALKTWVATDTSADPIDAPRLTQLWNRRVFVAAPPDFVLEAEIVPAMADTRPDMRLFTLAPVYARLAHPARASRSPASGSRDVAVFFAFHDSGTEPTDPRHAAGGLALGRLEPGIGVAFPPLDSETSATPNRAAGESRWFTLSLGAERKPMTITALVTEHRDPQAFLQFLAAVLTGARTSVSDAIERIIIPSQREFADEADRTRSDASFSAYEDAMAKAMAAATRCSDGVSNALGMASDVRARVRTVNRHARAVGKRDIDEQLVPLVLDAGRVQAGCIALRAALADMLRAG